MGRNTPVEEWTSNMVRRAHMPASVPGGGTISHESERTSSRGVQVLCLGLGKTYCLRAAVSWTTGGRQKMGRVCVVVAEPSQKAEAQMPLHPSFAELGFSVCAREGGAGVRPGVLKSRRRRRRAWTAAAVAAASSPQSDSHCSPRCIAPLPTPPLHPRYP